MTQDYMDLNEFRDKGYLQEVNRRFFHPLGLALTVEMNYVRRWDRIKSRLHLSVADDAPLEVTRILGVADAREADEEGWFFSPSDIHSPKYGGYKGFVDRMNFVHSEALVRYNERMRVFGRDPLGDVWHEILQQPYDKLQDPS